MGEFMDGYATHLPALVAAVSFASPGPVLELGSGTYSTPILHALCAAMGRQLVTLDNDLDWIARFAAFRSPSHCLTFVEAWDGAIADEWWAVVFVDHAPAERRKIEIENLRHKCELMVVHDTEDDRYEYPPDLLAKFKYRIDYKHVLPWTTVLSMTRNLSPLVGI